MAVSYCSDISIDFWCQIVTYDSIHVIAGIYCGILKTSGVTTGSVVVTLEIIKLSNTKLCMNITNLKL